MKRAALLGALLVCGAADAAEPSAVKARALDERGHARSSASLSRTLPPELGKIPGPDEDALHFLLISPPDGLLESLDALVLGADGKPLDVQVNLRTEPATCPDDVGTEVVCRSTAALRLVSDELERHHPALERRSLRAELGGTLRLSSAGKRILELPVTGPLGLPPVQAQLRVLVLRAQSGGTPALGGTDAGAERVVQRELATAAGLWAQCGVSLGKPSIEIVNPPRGRLLTLGCDRGLPASGGELRLKIGSKTLALPTRPGESPISVAWRLAGAVGGSVFENQRASGEALASADVWLKSPSNLVTASTDPSLPLCVGEVDLSDGLSHFGDGDAFVGTLEERALLRAFDDGDPSTVELFVVPRFESGERIGESFIVSSGSSLSSAIILDRSAVTAGARSFALAHELGHVLLAMPGHPDDYGVDQSWSLMDADVADPTIFGPRRLSAADCRRAVTQAGPGALVPILKAVR